MCNAVAMQKCSDMSKSLEIRTQLDSDKVFDRGLYRIGA